MENEYGEELSSESLDELTARIRKLPSAKIDELWHRCAFSYGGDGTYKALDAEKISAIKTSARDARMFVESFFLETPLEEITKNLAELEQERE